MTNPSPSSSARAALIEAVKAFDRAALGRAITLIESKKPEHKADARVLLMAVLPLAGRAHRIGITGAPGVGKSTFIDQLGCDLVTKGHKVAVLAVDPSSNRSGGAILGDKTRMSQLAALDDAFIRPSPASGTLGGVARSTRETMLLCEAAGFDIILVETVGVGQSETAVANMVDFFLVLMLPGGGDELQGIKKGVVELADMIAITKADQGNEPRAAATAQDYQAALHILTPAHAAWRPPVVSVSALEKRGLDELWQKIKQHHRIFGDNGAGVDKRREQDVAWLKALIEDQLHTAFLSAPGVQDCLLAAEQAVREGHEPASLAADRVMAEVLPLLFRAKSLFDEK